MQPDRKLVPGVQLHSHDNTGAVFKVLTTFFNGVSHIFTVNLQSDAVAQGYVSRAVNRDGEAVDTGAGHGEDASLHIVAVSQVDEDMFVLNYAITGEGAIDDHVWPVV